MKNLFRTIFVSIFFVVYSISNTNAFPIMISLRSATDSNLRDTPNTLIRVTARDGSILYGPRIICRDSFIQEPSCQFYKFECPSINFFPLTIEIAEENYSREIIESTDAIKFENKIFKKLPNRIAGSTTECDINLSQNQLMFLSRENKLLNLNFVYNFIVLESKFNRHPKERTLKQKILTIMPELVLNNS